MAVGYAMQVGLSITYYAVSSLSLIVLAVLGYAAVLYLTNKRFYDINAKLPGWKHWPVVGDALHFRSDNIGFYDDLLKLLSTRRKQGVFMFALGMRHFIIPTNAHETEKILSSSVTIDKAREYSILTPWLGLSLLTSGGSFWRSRRKLLTPSFHFNILKGFLSVINEVSNNLRELLLEKADTDQAFDIAPYISHTSLDIINETAMGTKLDALHDHNSEYVQDTTTLKDIAFQRFVKPHLYWKTIFDLTSVGRRHNSLVEKMHIYTMKEENVRIQQRYDYEKMIIINDRREARKCELQSAKYKAFLDILLDCTTEDGKPLTDEEIRMEVDTFMFEGHDTTASAIDHCIYVLASHPEVQRNCQEELDETFGSQRDVEWNDLSKLNYIECCIKEAMRLYPVVPLFSRNLPQDTEIGGHLVAAGSTITVVSKHLHTDPEHFPNPEKFDPTRFLPENSAGRHPYSYIPFSAGPRNCIGQRLAMMEMKVVLAMLLRNFNITTSQKKDKVIDNPGIVLESVSGIWIKLRTRS